MTHLRVDTLQVSSKSICIAHNNQESHFRVILTQRAIRIGANKDYHYAYTLFTYDRLGPCFCFAYIYACIAVFWGCYRFSVNKYLYMDVIWTHRIRIKANAQIFASHRESSPCQ